MPNDGCCCVVIVTVARDTSEIPDSTTAAIPKHSKNAARFANRLTMALNLLRKVVALSFWLTCIVAQTVDVKVTPFKNLPSRIFYFDDTSVSIARQCYRWFDD